MSSRDPARPTPDELLRRLEEEDARSTRGRLKIFLGYAPRVGKSARMFDEGRRRAARGQDVVVGAIQTQGSEAIQPFLRDLEIIPCCVVTGSPVLDVDAILQRAPQVCLVDELARDNPPGSRHPHRWMDVAQLVAAGITVLSALNLQYVAEQQDAVERVTGRRAACSVPESFLHSADEIVIVDVPPEAGPNCGAQLDSHQLSGLRELALLLAAQVVEEQLLRYMQTHGIRQSWGTQERILVCLTPRSNARPMLESAALAARRFHAHLFAIYIDQGELSREAREALEKHLGYARNIGACVETLHGHPIDTILDYAREHRITQLFIGHTQPSPWKLWAQSPVDRLIQAAEGMDVRIFPHTPSG